MNTKHIIYGAWFEMKKDSKFSVFDLTKANAIKYFEELQIDWTDRKPTVYQIAKFVCEFYDVPILELKENRQLRYLVKVRKAIAFLVVKIHDPQTLGILKHQIYRIKIMDGLRKELGGVIGRVGPTASHLIRGAINEYLMEKDTKLLYHYFEYTLNQDYGKDN